MTETKTARSVLHLHTQTPEAEQLLSTVPTTNVLRLLSVSFADTSVGRPQYQLRSGPQEWRCQREQGARGEWLSVTLGKRCLLLPSRECDPPQSLRFAFVEASLNFGLARATFPRFGQPDIIRLDGP